MASLSTPRRDPGGLGDALAFGEGLDCYERPNIIPVGFPERGDRLEEVLIFLRSSGFGRGEIFCLPVSGRDSY